jgi:hypothetical protein
MKKKLIFLAVMLIISLRSFSQCAMCRAVLESEVDQSAAKGINDGIVYLMAIPYVLFFGVAYYIYRKYNNAKA